MPPANDDEIQEDYVRVIPRDLFNEANLLKCYGRIFIEAETTPGVVLNHNPAEAGSPFRIGQNQSDGSLTITDVVLTVHGHDVALFRPMNARGSYPLYGSTNETIHGYPEGDVFEIFNEDGTFHDDFKERIAAWEPKPEVAKAAGPVAHRHKSPSP